MYLPIEQVKQLEHERQHDLLQHRSFTNGLIFTYNDHFTDRSNDQRVASVIKSMTSAFKKTNYDIDSRCVNRKRMKSKHHSFYYQIETGFSGRPHIHMLLDLSNYHPETKHQFLNNLNSSYCGKNQHNPKIGLMHNMPMNSYNEKEYDNLVRYHSKAFKSSADDGLVRFYDHYFANHSLIKNLNKKSRAAGGTLLAFGLN